MTEIDWSKAPEGATHYCPETDDFMAAWFKPSGDKWLYMLAQESRIPWRTLQECFPGSMPIVERQTPWSGEGLPPVGTVCEFWGGTPDPLDPWHPALKDGTQVVVIAHYENMGCLVAVFTFADARPGINGMQVEQAVEGFFRPIRTPEQIAAEERSKECDRIYGILSSVERTGNMSDMAEALYDAGYRLVEGGSQ